MKILHSLRKIFNRQKTTLPLLNPAVAIALELLARENVPNSTIEGVRRYAISADKRFCALTMENYESFVVDLKLARYQHIPTAGVTGFIGSKLVLSPDDERFSLGPTYSSYELDLLTDPVEWHDFGGAKLCR